MTPTGTGPAEEGRRRVETKAKWAETVGYSRAVRAGNTIHVSGTAPVAEDGSIAWPGDGYRQTLRCLQIIEGALLELGAGMEHVVRTRMYVSDRLHWQDVGRGHGEYFRDLRPATTMVFTGLIDADMIVEIEAEAVL
jgi:enamine deaminase RidA (YjgF/YER057c/UK114 family)